MVKITLGDKVFEVEKDTRIIDFMNSYGISNPSPVVGAIVNNESRSLRHKLDEDAVVSLIDYTTSEGVSIYRRSLLFLFIRVCEDVKINDCITFFLNVNTSVFANTL